MTSGQETVSPQMPFLKDGRRRARAAAEAEIRKEVLVEFRERLHASGWIDGFWLRREIKREVERRLDQIAPRHGHYLGV